MFIAFAASFVVYAWSEWQIDHANRLREQSYLLADELRQSSDDLTRMVRSYVVTGDTIYRQRYQEVLDIRDGRNPRPVAYQFVYWDLVLADDQRPGPAGPAVPLLELMRRAGFTEKEFARLADAKANSDALTRTEFAAMNVIGSADPPAEASRARAIATLYDAAYHQAKAGIMRPIGDFQRLADRRTLAAVEDAIAHATRMRLIFILFGLLLVFFLWRAQRNLYAILGGSVGELYGRIAELGSGKSSRAIPVAKGMENSVLGWLSQTQVNLDRIDVQRKNAEEQLAAQKQRAEITLCSIGDGVITTDADERVEFLNPVAEQLSGWAASECEGRQVTEILEVIDATSGEPVETPLRQALAEKRIVSFGRDVDLVRRDGSRIGIDDSAAPICGPDGGVTGGVLIFRDVSKARALTHQRSWEAAHDPLTGLVNRREFESLLEGSVAVARTAGKHHVVCFMDLDQFKVVNDTCGHAAGDDLLEGLAALLRSRIRESDTLARLGGDEFGLLLDGCSLERAQFIAADLLAAVADFRFTWEGKTLTVGVSIGLAAITGDNSSSAEALSMADTACYWAKEQGRNRVCVYRAGDSDMATRRRELGWIARINSALAEDRFTLYHQSFLPLNSEAEACRHIEVLLRMIDEDGNLVQPGSFLPAAERYNLMPTIDRWVVRTVFAGYHGLVAAGGGAPLTCAINLSGTSLNAEGFLDFIRQQALAHALPPQSICFEITETAAINNLRNAAEFIKECKAMGFLFALDDFGTGTSSFGYLKNLPVDYLKIDGGFVKNLERDAVDKAMTETINRIGHIMGIKTVAEYAENDAIIEELKHIGVDYAQGYGVCLPTPLFESDLGPVSLLGSNARGPLLCPA
jgi:diguanylate cyclase (GGDEF)-like protein/PAS domain S-box-containing protein